MSAYRPQAVIVLAPSLSPRHANSVQSHMTELAAFSEVFVNILCRIADYKINRIEGLLPWRYAQTGA